MVRKFLSSKGELLSIIRTINLCGAIVNLIDHLYSTIVLHQRATKIDVITDFTIGLVLLIID
ncbi:P3 protein [Yerba mate virus A]|uniref:P3 protein n=1 Tax=Yerba mate virus A TaxID=2713499 RepID=A0A6G6CIH1_9RHAB|nr:P3 protein [Yerba mate virus A]QID92307.1 P3 protein [Yerba mate virus A]